jgi:hypothetical protein
MISSKEIRRLAPFEECAGSLKELFEQDGVLIALIGKIHLYLPIDLEHSLRPLIGQRIAILHTDIAAKQYLFRLLDQETTYHKKASVQEDCISI